MCFDQPCPVQWDTLTRQDVRILEARNLLARLSDLNIGSWICRKMDIELDDIRLIAELEDEIQRLTPHPKA